MKAMLCNTALAPAFELIRRKKAGQLRREDAEALLDHEDYRFEFKRYEERVTRQEFAAYLMTFETLEAAQIENMDLRNHHGFWLDLYENLSWFEEKTKAFFGQFDEAAVEEAGEIAAAGFPNHYRFGDCKVIFTCGIGQSFGYANENGMHFDIMQLFRHYENENFKLMIAHEIHHLIFLDNIPFDEKSLEGYFLQWFAIEGLAVKFTGNAQGVLSQKLRPDLGANLGLDAGSMEYANARFEKNFREFRDTLQKIRQGEIKTLDEVRALLVGYWFNLYADGQSREEPPRLKQPSLYAFGNDLWGTLYDVFGMEELYKTLRHPVTFAEKFNEALGILHKEEYRL